MATPKIEQPPHTLVCHVLLFCERCNPHRLFDPQRPLPTNRRLVSGQSTPGVPERRHSPGRRLHDRHNWFFGNETLALATGWRSLGNRVLCPRCRPSGQGVEPSPPISPRSTP